MLGGLGLVRDYTYLKYGEYNVTYADYTFNVTIIEYGNESSCSNVSPLKEAVHDHSSTTINQEILSCGGKIYENNEHKNYGRYIYLSLIHI